MMDRGQTREGGEGWHLRLSHLCESSKVSFWYIWICIYIHTHFNLHCSMLRKRIVCVVPAGYGVPLRDGGRNECYCTKTEIIPIG